MVAGAGEDGLTFVCQRSKTELLRALLGLDAEGLGKDFDAFSS